MSADTTREDRKKASAELSLAAERLQQVANAYRVAWQLQRQATDNLEQAGQYLRAVRAGASMPREVKDCTRSIGAAVMSAELLHLDVDEENVLEAEARAVEEVAGAARRLASALDNLEALFPEGGEA